MQCYLAPETVSSEAFHPFVRLCLHQHSVAALCCSEEQCLLLLALLLLVSSLLCLLLLWSWAGMLCPACGILPLPLLQAGRPYPLFPKRKSIPAQSSSKCLLMGSHLGNDESGLHSLDCAQTVQKAPAS